MHACSVAALPLPGVTSSAVAGSRTKHPTPAQEYGSPTATWGSEIWTACLPFGTTPCWYVCCGFMVLPPVRVTWLGTCRQVEELALEHVALLRAASQRARAFCDEAASGGSATTSARATRSALRCLELVARVWDGLLADVLTDVSGDLTPAGRVAIVDIAEALARCVPNAPGLSAGYAAGTTPTAPRSWSAAAAMHSGYAAGAMVDALQHYFRVADTGTGAGGGNATATAWLDPPPLALVDLCLQYVLVAACCVLRAALDEPARVPSVVCARC